MPSAPSDLELILSRAALAGDRAAWQTLYDSAAVAVHRYAVWRCGGRADLADDATQDAWLTVAKSLHRFDSASGSFLNWVYGITANAIRNRLRGWKRATGRTTEWTGSETRPDDQTAIEVAEALAGLPSDYEQVLRMKYLDGRSVSEIATLLGEGDKAIESRLTRAREAFRKVYRHDG